MTAFDRPGLLERLEGDEEFLRELAKMFLEDSPTTLDGLKDALAANDAEETRRFAHGLKGAAANISGAELSELARAVEKAGSDGDVTRAAALLPEVEAAMGRLVQALEEELDTR